MPYLINPWTFLLWIGLSWVVGLLGRDKKFGLFGNFLVALIFSPLVGFIVLLASDDRPTVARRPSRK
ncbi:hypothetical protein [Roseospira navarrensis]|uniref:Uncharacterized protein n=1 Tax=Roseospira navarrensis TaxID=140058 RepID=A0A7X1ZBW4_9PROT|nr:hypothetical protein [Roseospira navarrensis]MQX35698.1 hypothetical protein [Roseospira navarrensis]